MKHKEYLMRFFNEGIIVCKENGEIFKNGKQILGHMHTNGYLRVLLCNSKFGKKQRIYAHQIVYLFFNRDADFKGKNINHKNGIKTDNRIDNIELITAEENTRHAHQIGLKKPLKKGTFSGEDSSTAKLNWKAVEFIRLNYPKIKQVALAKMFKVRQGQISNILLNKTWKEEYRPKSH